MRNNVSDCIFQPNQNDQANTSNDNAFYGYADDYDFLDKENNPRLNVDNDRTLAKKLLRDDGSFKFFVKTNATKKLFNPMSIYGKTEIGSTFLDKTCKDFKFRSVSKKIFDLYINFLRTKNMSWFYNAEREAE